MNNKIIDYLIDKGYKPYRKYYPYIDNWIEMWEGKTDFHKYKVQYDDKTYEQEMYSLGMPQRISQDWASICWTEKDEIVTIEKDKKFLDKVLKELKFNQLLPLAIEKSAYSGTCAAILKIKNAKLINEELQTDKFTQFELILMRANQIIPLRTEHGKIIDCAFVSESRLQDKKIYYIEIHELVKRKDESGELYNSYKISNIYLNNEGKEIDNMNVIKEYYTNSDIPLFSILTPPVDNPIEESNGLGYSIFGGAIDQLKAVDIAYNNMVMDYYLGGKKIFYNKKLCRIDDKGNVIFPTDVQKQQWQIVGDTMENANENGLIHEYNPDLRVDENTQGLQFFLDLLSFKCGLGTKYYEFNNSGSVVTATQYAGERQDLTINARKFRENVDEFIINICKGILLYGRILFKANVNENDTIKVVNKDGFLVSEEDLKEQYLQEISAGLRSKTSYMVRFGGMTEEEARKEIALINEEDSISNVDLIDEDMSE